jgi:hypothetical protein
MKVLAVTSLLLTTLALGRAGASNLLTNPDFNESDQLAGWTWAADNGQSFVCGPGSECGNMHFSNSECCGGSASGSVASNSAFFFLEELDQCVTGIEANTSYDFGVWIRLTSASGLEPGLPGVGLTWYSSSDCTGPGAGGASQFVAPAVWTRVAMPGNIAPANSRSAKFSLYAGPTGDAGTSVGMEFDGAFFGPSGTVPVELQSFVVD